MDAHYNASKVDDYFQIVHSRNNYDTNGASQLSLVHYDDDSDGNYNNAFWSGSLFVYGDGDGSEFLEFSGALDVVGHEWTHAVTDYSSNLVYQNESGALNESFSDQMSASIEAHVEGAAADWFLAEDIDIGGNGFRNMADPEEDGWFLGPFPDHYSELYIGDLDRGGVHINSSIPNHWFYLLAQTEGHVNMNASCASPGDHNSDHCIGVGLTNVTGIGLADAEKISYLTFTALPSNATMAQVRATSEDIAAMFAPGGSLDDGDAVDEGQSTTDAWLAVGVGPLGPVTDIAVTSVSAPTSAARDSSVNVDVTVENVGNENVTGDFDVSLEDTTPGILIGAQTISGGLDAGASTVLTFSWAVPLGAALGDHTLEGEHDFSPENPINSGNDNTTAVVTVNDGSITGFFVQAMDLNVVKKGPWYNLTVTMAIEDASGPAADGVIITGAIFRDGANFNRSDATEGGVAVWKLKTQIVGEEYTVQVTGADDGSGSTLDTDSGVPCKTITIDPSEPSLFTEGPC